MRWQERFRKVLIATEVSGIFMLEPVLFQILVENTFVFRILVYCNTDKDAVIMKLT